MYSHEDFRTTGLQKRHHKLTGISSGLHKRYYCMFSVASLGFLFRNSPSIHSLTECELLFFFGSCTLSVWIHARRTGYLEKKNIPSLLPREEDTAAAEGLTVEYCLPLCSKTASTLKPSPGSSLWMNLGILPSIRFLLSLNLYELKYTRRGVHQQTVSIYLYTVYRFSLYVHYIHITHLQYLLSTKKRVLPMNETWTAASTLVTYEGKPKSVRGLG